MILPMFCSFSEFEWIADVLDLGAAPRISRLCFGDHDQCGAQGAIGDQVALLQHGDDGIGFLFGVDHADGLVLVRIELLAGRIDFDQGVLLEGGNQLLQGQFDTGFETFDGLLLARPARLPGCP